jgi:amino-acid N-acetyltransferase
MPQLAPLQFVQWFRSAAPYIHAFRGHTFVVAFGGEVVADKKFIELIHDFNLLNSLGVRLVLVHGARLQIESLLAERKIKSLYKRGLRITDSAALECVKQSAGKVRSEIEALLSMGLANSPMAGSEIRVAGGNFVTAKPLGVLAGVDMQHTGEVRKINSQAIHNRLNEGEIVLLSAIGYSPTGEIFNLSLEDVATQTAIALNANKLIFLTETAGVTDHKGNLQRELDASKAETFITKIKSEPNDIDLYLPFAIKACQNGVARVHFISRHVDGAILLELFTREGIGSLITQTELEKLRNARIEDVGQILSLIEPLEADGTLVKRGRELLEMEIDRFSVLEHDGAIVGCAALYPFAKEKTAELACLAIRKDCEGNGYGSALLKYIEAKAKKLGIKKLFVLTTRTAHWFIDKGFTEHDVEHLPEQKQSLYNYQRKSKVFLKNL